MIKKTYSRDNNGVEDHSLACDHCGHFLTMLHVDLKSSNIDGEEYSVTEFRLWKYCPYCGERLVEELIS